MRIKWAAPGLLVALLQPRAGAWYNAVVGTGSSHILETLTELCRPGRSLVENEMSSLHGVFVQYLHHVESELRRLWRQECIFEGWGIKAGVDASSLSQDLEKIVEFISRCNPTSSIVSDERYTSFVARVLACKRDIDEFFAYHILSYGVEQMVEVSQGQSNLFHWHGLVRIQFPTSEKDFERYLLELNRRYPYTNLLTQYCLLGRRYESIVSNRPLEMVLQAKPEKIELLAAHHLLVGSHLLEIRTVKTAIERKFVIPSSGPIMEVSLLLGRLESILHDMLWLLYKYKRIPAIDLQSLDVARISSKFCIVDRRFDINMDEAVYQSSLVLIHLLDPFQRRSKPHSVEAREMIQAQATTFLDLFRQKLERLEELLAYSCSSIDVIAPEIKIIQTIANYLFFALRDFDHNKCDAQDFDLVPLKTTLQKALAYTLYRSASLLIIASLDVYTGRSSLLRLTDIFDRIIRTKGTKESFEAYVCRLEVSLAAYDRFAEAFATLFVSTHIVAYDPGRLQGPVELYLASISARYQQNFDILLETIARKYLELQDIRTILDITIDKNNPSLRAAHRGAWDRVTRLLEVLTNMLQLFLKIRGASHSLICNVGVRATREIVTLFNRLNEEECITLDRASMSTVLPVDGDYRHLLGNEDSAIQRFETFGSLYEVVKGDRASIYEVFDPARVPASPPFRMADASMNLLKSILYVRRAKIFVRMMVIGFFLMVLVAAGIFCFDSQGTTPGSEKATTTLTVSHM